MKIPELGSWLESHADARPGSGRLRPLFALAALATLPSLAQAQSGKPGKGAEEADLFFRGGAIPRLVIELDEKTCDELRNEPRKYVEGRLNENERNVFEGVSVKLKGAAGSFREFDDWPSFTVRMDRVDADQEFHGLKKFALNKSPQDPTYIRELLGSELFRAAGTLAPRIGHARVWVNKRDMGLYVIKEGFDVRLVKRGFEKWHGSLYDGGFCQDLDADLEKDEGKDKKDLSDLHALRAAVQEPDMKKRWARIEELVDVKAFITFMAMEMMSCHWDGYCLNRNNYRLYFDPLSKKAFFLPHGMDQILGDPEAGVLDMPVAMLASSVMKNPAWRAEFRKRLAELTPLFAAEKLKKRVDELAKRLQPAIEDWNRDEVANHQNAVNWLKQVIEGREKFLKEQRGLPEPRPLVFAPDVPVRLAKWRRASECEDASFNEDKDNGVDVLQISCGRSGRCVAGYRRSVLLAKGRYKFHAAIRVKDVAPLDGDDPAIGVGAGTRISGRGRENTLVGTADWQPVDFEFEVAEETADVELVVELRSSRGTATIRADSLWLARLGK